MKLTLLILATLFAAFYARDVQQLIETVNQKQSLWVAGHNKFSHMSKDKIRARMGLRDTRPTPEQVNLQTSTFEKPKYRLSDNDLPKNFDISKKWPDCVQDVRNQEHCGSCWAFSAVESLGTRFCIASNSTVKVTLSAQDLVSCSSLDFGCNGGMLSLAEFYMYWTGVVPNECMPYVSGDGHVPDCPRTCTGSKYSGKAIKDLKFHAKKVYPLWVDLPSRRVGDIKKDLVENGPVQTGFTVYEDFMNYQSGVYKHTSGGVLGGHAVMITGYGIDDATGTPYWRILNSWGKDWGEDGYFRIVAGENECGIEGDAWAGIPNLNKIPDY